MSLQVIERLQPQQFTPRLLSQVVDVDSLGKDARSRIAKFDDYLTSQGLAWFTVDLATYRDYLKGNLSPASINVHLSTLRGRIREIISNPDATLAIASNVATPGNFADLQAKADYIRARIEYNINSKRTAAKETVKQDRTDQDQTRLTQHQAQTLIDRPFTQDRALTDKRISQTDQTCPQVTAKSYRDSAIIAFALLTGAREFEIAAATWGDIARTADGEPGFDIRHGKGNKARFVPFGPHAAPLLARLEAWRDQLTTILDAVEDGVTSPGFALTDETPLFVSLTSAGNLYRGDVVKPLTTRSLERMIAGYTISIDQKIQSVTMHDLRRSYAKLNYDAGMGLAEIQQNLGHASIDTTMTYIGEQNMHNRGGKVEWELPAVA